MTSCATSQHRPSSAADLLPLARTFVPQPLTLDTYIAQLNTHTHPSPAITLHLPHPAATPAERAYEQLICRLIVAFPADIPTRFPPNAAAERHLTPAISLDQLLTEVISSALRRHRTPFTAAHHNVLCSGFDHAKQNGPGSPFRNLDARSPSAPIQVLRTPPWRLLLHTLGHTVLRHLLASAFLLLCVDENPQTSALQTSEAPKSKPSSVLLQLCGPFSLGITAPQYCRLPQSASTIVLKQDLLYKTPMRRRPVANSCPNPGLPATHHLNHLVDMSQAAVILQHVIFPTVDANTDSYSASPIRNYDKVAVRFALTALSNKRGKKWLARRKALPKRLGKVVPLLSKVITRVRATSFRRILSLFVPYDRPKSPAPFERLSKSKLFALHTPPKRVARFVIACLKHLLPQDLLGPPSHRYLLERAVHSFVRYRRQRETFDVRRFFLAQSGLALTAVSWLWRQKPRGATEERAGASVCNPTDFQFRQDRMLDLLVWVFRGIVIPLLQQNFFTTEGTVNRNRVLFFRREVWSHLVDRTMSGILSANAQFSILSKDQLRTCVQQRADVLAQLGWRHFSPTSFQYHELRFIPKKNSMRGIQRPRVKSMAAFRTIEKGSSRMRDAKAKRFQLVKGSFNSIRVFMRNVHAVLMAEVRTQPQLMGASVFSLDDIYPKYLNLVENWKRMGKPRMYFCCFDITNSFDTIPLKHLFEDVVPEALARGRYPIVKFRSSKLDKMGNVVRSKFSSHVCLDAGDEASFSRLLRDRIASREPGTIVTDLANMTAVGRDEVLQALNEFLRNNLICIPRRYRTNHEAAYAIQTQGLPQGHPLSSLLTSLFYGHVEKNELGEFLHGSDVGSSSDKAMSLLMRLVDDTIFASSSKKLTCLFMQRMTAGWMSSHGFSVNKQKTRTSFAAGLGGAENLRTIPWCGLLIDAETLEVRGDYERYCSGGNRLRDSLSIEQEWQAGRIVSDRAASCFKPKLHPLLLDPRINSPLTIALNAYQAAVLACLKLCAHVHVFPPTNPSVFESLVDRAASNFQRLAVRAAAKRKPTLQRCHTTLTAAHIRYLTAHAFRSCLDKRLSVVSLRSAKLSCLTSMTKAMRSAHGCIGGGYGAQLERMADGFSQRACHSLWRIVL